MVKVKICGLSRVEDIAAVNQALPDYIGFVFASSRRQVSVETAVELRAALDSRIQAVGVFVNEDVSVVVDLVERDIINLAQLHGDEDDGYIRQLKQACGCPVIKAVGIGGGDGTASLPGSLPRLADLPQAADYLLFDSAADSQRNAAADSQRNAAAADQRDAANPRGGSGQRFDWQILANFTDLPYFLAGGLTTEDVPKALAVLSPYCLDVSSGVETGGKKDPIKIAAFVRSVRSER